MGFKTVAAMSLVVLVSSGTLAASIVLIQRGSDDVSDPLERMRRHLEMRYADVDVEVRLSVVDEAGRPIQKGRAVIFDTQLQGLAQKDREETREIESDLTVVRTDALVVSIKISSPGFYDAKRSIVVAGVDRSQHEVESGRITREVELVLERLPSDPAGLREYSGSVTATSVSTDHVILLRESDEVFPPVDKRLQIRPSIRRQEHIERRLTDLAPSESSLPYVYLIPEVGPGGRLGILEARNDVGGVVGQRAPGDGLSWSRMIQMTDS